MNLQEIKATLQPHFEEVHAATKELFFEVEQSCTRIARKTRKALNANQKKNVLASITLGSKFKSLCIVGLNKTELIPHKGEDSLISNNWQDMMDDSTRKNAAMLFFAPRDLSGNPVNPYLFLGGEELELEDEEEQALFMQSLGNMSLFDYCRIPAAPAGEVGIILAGDALFHWDSNDNYILPTTENGWPRDVMSIMKAYPRNTNVTLYTNWDTDIFSQPPENINFRPLFDAPLEEETWVNQPTFQEKYGGSVLLMGFAFAALMGLGLYTQHNKLAQLDQEMRRVEQDIPREGKFMRLARSIRDQQSHMHYRHLFPLVVQDTARTIFMSEMKVANFEVRNPTPQNAATQYISTIEAEREAYKGWLQEEPIAKAILMNSATFEGLRKPPGKTFKLEGLVTLRDLNKKHKEAQKRQLTLNPEQQTGEGQ